MSAYQIQNFFEIEEIYFSKAELSEKNDICLSRHVVNDQFS